MRLSNALAVAFVASAIGVLAAGCNSAPQENAQQGNAELGAVRGPIYYPPPIYIAPVCSLPGNLYSNTCDSSTKGYWVSVKTATTTCPTLQPDGYTWDPESPTPTVTTSQTTATPAYPNGTFVCSYPFSKLRAVFSTNSAIIGTIPPDNAFCITDKGFISYNLGPLPEMVRLPPKVSFRGHIINSSELPPNSSCPAFPTLQTATSIGTGGYKLPPGVTLGDGGSSGCDTCTSKQSWP